MIHLASFCKVELIVLQYHMPLDPQLIAIPSKQQVLILKLLIYANLDLSLYLVQINP
jgi:hypothetical protein